MEQKKTFTKVTLGGYDPQEVDDYIKTLEQKIATSVSPKIEKQTEVPTDFLEQFERIKGELKGYKEIEVTLREALEAAHKATIDIQEVVDKEARQILFEANKNADQIIQQSLQQSIAALNYIKKMRIDARVFQKRFKILIEAQNEFSDSNLWDEVLAPIDPYEVVEITKITDIIKNEDER